MVPLSRATRARLDALFGDEPAAASLLGTECGDNLPWCAGATPESLERIRFAAMKLSRGTLDGLREAVSLAKTDWRDLLVSAGFGDDVKAHLAWKP